MGKSRSEEQQLWIGARDNDSGAERSATSKPKDERFLPQRGILHKEFSFPSFVPPVNIFSLKVSRWRTRRLSPGTRNRFYGWVCRSVFAPSSADARCEQMCWGTWRFILAGASSCVGDRGRRKSRATAWKMLKLRAVSQKHRTDVSDYLADLLSETSVVEVIFWLLKVHHLFDFRPQWCILYNSDTTYWIFRKLQIKLANQTWRDYINSY